MNQLQYQPYPDIQPLPQRNSYNTRDTFTQLLTLVAFVLYSYFLFQNYAKGGNMAWLIVPSIFLIIMLGINLKTSFSPMNISLTVAILLVSISLFLSAQKIRQKHNTNKEAVYQSEIKYLVSIMMFGITALFTVSPIGDWIAGGTDKALYSRNFVFMYAMISYGIYTMYDTIRNYNLFDLQSTLFGKVKQTDSTQFGIVLAVCLWMIYSLLVFEGIQFIGSSGQFDSRHYITIALLTLLWLVFTFSYSQKVNQDCSQWKSEEAKQDSQEIYLNVITTTVILLILSVVDRYIRL